MIYLQLFNVFLILCKNAVCSYKQSAAHANFLKIGLIRRIIDKIINY